MNKDAGIRPRGAGGGADIRGVVMVLIKRRWLEINVVYKIYSVSIEGYRKLIFLIMDFRHLK